MFTSILRFLHICRALLLWAIQHQCKQSISKETLKHLPIFPVILLLPSSKYPPARGRREFHKEMLGKKIPEEVTLRIAASTSGSLQIQLQDWNSLKDKVGNKFQRPALKWQHCTMVWPRAIGAWSQRAPTCVQLGLNPTWAPQPSNTRAIRYPCETSNAKGRHLEPYLLKLITRYLENDDAQGVKHLPLETI